MQQPGKNDPLIIKLLAQESLTVSDIHRKKGNRLSVSNIENSINRLKAQGMIEIEKQDSKWKGGKQRVHWQLTFRGFLSFLKDEKENYGENDNAIKLALERYKDYGPVWLKCYEPLAKGLGLPRFRELLHEAATSVFMLGVERPARLIQLLKKAGKDNVDAVTRSIRKRDEQLIEDFDMEFVSLLREEPHLVPIPNKELRDRFGSLFQHRINIREQELEKLKSTAYGVSLMFDPDIAASQIEQMKKYQPKKAQLVEQTEKG
jgi:DNA-binding transcriptional ArsR family regulator